LVSSKYLLQKPEIALFNLSFAELSKVWNLATRIKICVENLLCIWSLTAAFSSAKFSVQKQLLTLFVMLFVGVPLATCRYVICQAPGTSWESGNSARAVIHAGRQR